MPANRGQLQACSPVDLELALTTDDVNRLCRELAVLHHRGPGFDPGGGARAQGLVAEFREAPYGASVRARARSVSELFLLWFSKDGWDHRRDSGRRVKTRLLIAIYQLCAGLKAELAAHGGRVQALGRTESGGTLDGIGILLQGVRVANNLLDSASLAYHPGHAHSCRQNVADLLLTLRGLAQRIPLSEDASIRFLEAARAVEERLALRKE